MDEIEETEFNEDDDELETGDSLEAKKVRVVEINNHIKELLVERNELEKEIEDLNDDNESKE